MIDKIITEEYSEMLKQAKRKLLPSFNVSDTYQEIVQEVVLDILERVNREPDRFNRMAKTGEFKRYLYFTLNFNLRYTTSPCLRTRIAENSRRVNEVDYMDIDFKVEDSDTYDYDRDELEDTERQLYSDITTMLKDNYKALGLTYVQARLFRDYTIKDLSGTKLAAKYNQSVSWVWKTLKATKVILQGVYGDYDLQGRVK